MKAEEFNRITEELIEKFDNWKKIRKSLSLKELKKYNDEWTKEVKKISKLEPDKTENHLENLNCVARSNCISKIIPLAQVIQREYMSRLELELEKY